MGLFLRIPDAVIFNFFYSFHLTEAERLLRCLQKYE